MIARSLVFLALVTHSLLSLAQDHAEVAYIVEGAKVVGQSPASTDLVAKLCINFNKFDYSYGIYIRSIEISEMEFLAPIKAATVGQQYKLPVTSGDVFPVKIAARGVWRQREPKYTDMSRRGLLLKDAFGEWACVKGG
jgi:hypothetical protein